MDGHRIPFGRTYAHQIQSMQIRSDILYSCEQTYHVNPYDIPEKIYHESMLESFVQRHVMACFGFQGTSRFTILLTRYQGVPYTLWIPHAWVATNVSATSSGNAGISHRNRFLVTPTAFPDELYEDTMIVGELSETSAQTVFYMEQCVLYRGKPCTTHATENIALLTSLLKEWKPTRMDPVVLSIKGFYGIHQIGEYMDQQQYPIVSIRIYGLRMPVCFYVHKTMAPRATSRGGSYPYRRVFQSMSHSFQSVQQQRGDLETVYESREQHVATPTTPSADHPTQSICIKPIPGYNVYGVYSLTNPLECIGILRVVRYEDLHRIGERFERERIVNGCKATVQFMPEFNKYRFVDFE